MTDIIRVDTIEQVDPSPGAFLFQQTPVTYEVTAFIDDMVQIMPARIHPAELAEPAQFGPALCIGEFTLEPGEQRPPNTAPDIDLFRYLDDHITEWKPIDLYE